MDSVHVADAVLYYQVAGRGVPVLILSGGPGASSGYLRPIFDSLAASAHVTLLDQRGTGRTHLLSQDASTFTLRRSVSDVEALRARLGVARFVLLGHSWGGALAMAYAAEHPDRVAGLILVGSAGPSLRTQDTIAQRLNARLSQSDRDSIMYWSRLARDPSTRAEALAKVGYFTRRAYVYDLHNEPAIERSREADSVNPVVSRLTVQDLRTTNFDLAPALSKIDKDLPVLVLYGAADAIGVTTGPEILKALPAAQVRVIQRSGHYPWIEAPSAFYAAIRSFLDRAEQSAGRRARLDGGARGRTRGTPGIGSLDIVRREVPNGSEFQTAPGSKRRRVPWRGSRAIFGAMAGR